MTKSNEVSEPQGAAYEANFISAMKIRREALGLTQGELSKKMKEAGWSAMHPTTISRIESGERPVRMGEAIGISSALGASLVNMFYPSELFNAANELEKEVLLAGDSESHIRNEVRAYEHHRLMTSVNLDKLQELLSADADNSRVPTVLISRAKRIISQDVLDLVNDELIPEAFRIVQEDEEAEGLDDGIDSEA